MVIRFRFLSKAADGLVGNCMKYGKGDVFPGMPRFINGRMSAFANTPHLPEMEWTFLPRMPFVEIFYTDSQQNCHLIDESSGAASAATVHTHIGQFARSCFLIAVENHDLHPGL